MIMASNVGKVHNNIHLINHIKVLKRSLQVSARPGCQHLFNKYKQLVCVSHPG